MSDAIEQLCNFIDGRWAEAPERTPAINPATGSRSRGCRRATARARERRSPPPSGRGPGGRRSRCGDARRCASPSPLRSTRAAQRIARTLSSGAGQAASAGHRRGRQGRRRLSARGGTRSPDEGRDAAGGGSDQARHDAAPAPGRLRGHHAVELSGEHSGRISGTRARHRQYDRLGAGADDFDGRRRAHASDRGRRSAGRGPQSRDRRRAGRRRRDRLPSGHRRRSASPAARRPDGASRNAARANRCCSSSAAMALFWYSRTPISSAPRRRRPTARSPTPDRSAPRPAACWRMRASPRTRRAHRAGTRGITSLATRCIRASQWGRSTIPRSRPRCASMSTKRSPRARMLVTGGKPRPDLGSELFFEPTVLTGVTREMRINREETFGPVTPILSFRRRRRGDVARARQRIWPFRRSLYA